MNIIQENIFTIKWSQFLFFFSLTPTPIHEKINNKFTEWMYKPAMNISTDKWEIIYLSGRHAKVIRILKHRWSKQRWGICRQGRHIMIPSDMDLKGHKKMAQLRRCKITYQILPELTGHVNLEMLEMLELLPFSQL